MATKHQNIPTIFYEGLFVKIKNNAFYDIFGAKCAYIYLNSQIGPCQNAYLAKYSNWHASNEYLAK